MTNQRYLVSRNKREGWYAGSHTEKMRTKHIGIRLKQCKRGYWWGG